MRNKIYLLYRLINTKRKFQLLAVFAITLLSALFEIVGLGSVIPFLAALSDIKKFRIFVENNLSETFLNGIGDVSLIGWMAFFFCVTALLAGATRLILIYASTRVSFEISADLNKAIFSSLINSDFERHKKISIHESVDLIMMKGNAVSYNVVLPFINIVSSGVVSFVIISAAILVAVRPAIMIGSGLAIAYGVVVWTSKNILKKSGREISSSTPTIIKIVQETIGGIREIILYSLRDRRIRQFNEKFDKLKKSQVQNVFMGSYPRYAVESLGMVVIGVSAYIMSVNDSSGMGVIPILGFYALTAQRLLPIIQLVYYSYSQLISNEENLDVVLTIIRNDEMIVGAVTESVLTDSARKIELRDISFGYRDSKSIVFDSVDLEIKKGECIAIIGESGSGKTTFVDLFTGLLKPSSGKIFVDGSEINSYNNTNYMLNFSLVPQDIFIENDSVLYNITGVSDSELVVQSDLNYALENSSFNKVVDGLANGIYTVLGDRGKLISGGQRQKLAIARALYRNTPFLIFDEPTSSLDIQSELEIIRVIRQLKNNGKGIVIITHRHSCLDICDLVYEMKGRNLILVR